VLRLITLGRLALLRDGPPTEPIQLQPKRLALLAYLALTARDGYQRRDTLLALFWPRADRDHARRCLRQALFHLRNELGDDVLVNRGRDGLTLVSDRLWCDAVEVDCAMRAGRRGDALELYTGDFLPGLFLDQEGVELEEWVEQTRRRLRVGAAVCAWDLAEEHERAHRIGSALELAHRARALSPDDEQGLRRHMTLLARAGDSASALGAYTAFTRRLRREYDAEPSEASLALARELRHGRGDPLPVQQRIRYYGPDPQPSGTDPHQYGTDPQHHGTVPQNQHRRVESGQRGWQFPAHADDARRGVRRITAAGLALAAGLVLAEPSTRESMREVAGRLVVSEFANHTRDSLLGVAVTQAVRAELSKVARVDLAGVRAVHPPAAAGGLGADQVLILVTGEVTPLGSGYALSARLVAAGSGRVLGVVEEQADDTTGLVPVVQRLSERLRGDLQRSLQPQQAPR
jgi:DNA-binding SARP family transcriptional activator